MKDLSAGVPGSRSKKERKPVDRKLIIGAAAGALAFLALLCLVLGSTRGRERTVKVNYDGTSYTGQSSGRAHSRTDYYDTGEALMSGSAKNDAASMDLDASISAPPANSENYSDESFGIDVGQDDPDKSRKLTYTYDYSAETTDFDGLLKTVNDFLNSCGGYAESTNVISRDYDRYDLSGTDTVRRGTYYLKVPADQCDAFRSLLATSEADVTYENKRMSDKTQAYADYKLQKQSYQEEYRSLEALLRQADQVSDLIAIQDRLSYLNYQIQYMDKQMELIDEDVAYSDVTLTLYEVVYYTATIQEYRFRFGERMAEAFEDFVYAVPEFLFFLVFLAAAGFVVVGLCTVLFSVLFNIRNKKSKDQVVRLVDMTQKGDAQT